MSLRSILMTDITRWRRVGAEGAWILAGQIVTVIAALTLVRAVTGVLPPAAYGEVALGMTVATLVNQLITGCIANGISRYWSIADERGDLGAYVAAGRKMLAQGFVAIAIVGLIVIAGLKALGLESWIGLSVAAITMSVASGLNGALNGIQTAARQRPVVAVHSAAEAWLKIGLVLLASAWFGPSSTVVMWSYAASAGLISLSQIIFLQRLLRRRAAAMATAPASTMPLPTDWLRMMWIYSWPFACWGIFTWAQSASDRWALQFFANTSAVGQYAALYQLGFAPLTMASGMLVALLTPIMFQRAGDARDDERVAHVFRATTQAALGMFALTLIVAMLFGVLSDWIFRLFTAKAAYREAAPLMPLMALAAGLQACHHILGIRVSTLLETRSILMPQIASALMVIGLNALGAYLDGVRGLAIGMVVASFGYAAWMWVMSETMRLRSQRAAPGLAPSQTA